MKIIIKRYRKKTGTIDGRVFIDGSRICDCAENATTSLPTGQYLITIIKCHQHARKMPIIKFLDNSWVIDGNSRFQENPCESCPKLSFVGNNTCMPCRCAMLKAGNGVHNRTDGSIIVGSYLAPGCLSHPKQAFDYIYDRIRKNNERGNDVTLEIVENYPKKLTNFELGTQILAQMGGRPLNI